MTRQNYVQELSWRGLVYEATPDLEEAMAAGTLTGYIGFDPTASSLHVGSLLPILGLARLQRAGYKPVAIVGGGTGLIGDPSGKTKERQLLDREQVEANVRGIHAQLEHFLDFDCGDLSAKLVNNYDWLGELSFVDFLRDVGKHFSVNNMLAKESVKRRIESEDGISYTEFSYSLLQAYDYLELFRRHGCTLQMGGSDQWGNIVAGIDLIRRLEGAKCHGLVYPLITTKAGTKFGKTEAGTVWLDPERTSPYRYYQFWLQTEDTEVVKYLKFFTFLGQEEIAALEAAVTERPQDREAQVRLGEEMTRMTHGDAALARAKQISEIFFGGDIRELTASEILDVLADAPTTDVPRAELEGEGADLADLLARTELASSKGDARRAIKGGGMYLNGDRLDDPARRVKLDDTLHGQLLLFRKGKKNYNVVRLAGA